MTQIFYLYSVAHTSSSRSSQEFTLQPHQGFKMHQRTSSGNISLEAYEEQEMWKQYLNVERKFKASKDNFVLSFRKNSKESLTIENSEQKSFEIQSIIIPNSYFSIKEYELKLLRLLRKDKNNKPAVSSQ